MEIEGNELKNITINDLEFQQLKKIKIKGTKEQQQDAEDNEKLLSLFNKAKNLEILEFEWWEIPEEISSSLNELTELTLHCSKNLK